AEDGIRDWSVTGVQTCALPILPRGALADELVIKLRPGAALSSQALARGPHAGDLNRVLRSAGAGVARELSPGSDTYRIRVRPGRSEERRVGEEGTQPRRADGRR